MNMKINKFAGGRLLWGLMFIVLGLIAILSGKFSGNGAKATIYLHEYKDIVGGILIAIGVYMTYRAFTKN